MRLSEDQILIRDTVARFTQKEVAPIAEKMDREDYWPEDMFPKLGELGVLGITVPEKYGGIAGTPLTHVLVTEELAKGSAAVSLSYGAHSNLCVHNLYTHGNETQRMNYLPPLCSGRHVGALAITEPQAGSDAVSIQLSAVKDGDAYRLNGTKMFITNAPIADTTIVYAKTDKTKGARGITAFIVESGFEGFSVSRNLEKMGCKGSPTGEVVFDNCRVPESNLLGELNRGVEVMMSGLDIERVVMAGMCLGVSEIAFRASLKYSKEREQFGSPISHFQLIQAKLADMYTNLEAARLLVYDTAERSTSGQRLRKESAAAILFAAEATTKICNEAVQIHGGYGYMLEFPVNRYLRDAKLAEIGAGTSEIRRLLIARELLK